MDFLRNPTVTFMLISVNLTLKAKYLDLLTKLSPMF